MPTETCSYQYTVSRVLLETLPLVCGVKTRDNVLKAGIFLAAGVCHVSADRCSNIITVTVKLLHGRVASILGMYILQKKSSLRRGGPINTPYF